ncbi:SAF domain-containing protein [Promicromonospora sp. NPDC057488]|uniref:SAF domain-containing protein n=1 Tax=Promicromonospora sp. NPDC057488 TaxID=3346147 RepID=UPI00366D6E13
MTTTTPAPDAARAERPARAGSGPDGTDQLAPPPKMRRRPAMIALSVALVCVGGLVSGWAWQSTSNAQDVLAVRDTVHRGEVIEEGDLVTVRIGVDPAVKTIPAANLESVVGQRAALDIAAQSVITPDQVTDAVVPPKEQSVVGLSLSGAMLPTGQLTAGAQVRVVPTTGSTAAAPAAGAGNAPAAAATPAYAATVVKVAVDDITGNALVNVQVAQDVAPAVATLAAAGQVAVVLDSQEQ